MNFIDAMLILGAIATTAVVFIWVYRRRRPVAIEVVPQGQVPYYYPYTPGIQIVETNSGFTEGLIIGSMMQAGAPQTIVNETVINETVINETVVNETVVEEAPAAFTAFSGGDPDGDGASGSWADDTPSESASDYSGDFGSDSGDN